MVQQKNYILLGPPGSGKSTQAELLKKELDLIHIDIGAELRETSKEHTELGHTVNDIINNKHELAPDAVMSQVLQKALDRVPTEKGVLLDGAPRRASQIDEVIKVLEKSGRIIHKVIFINLSEKESVERISRRFICSSCGKAYILGKDLPDDRICTVCGGKIEQRKDDTKEGVMKRFQIFHTDTLPVIEHFEEAGKLMKVDGNQESEEIFQDILTRIRNDQ